MSIIKITLANGKITQIKRDDKKKTILYRTAVYGIQDLPAIVPDSLKSLVCY